MPGPWAPGRQGTGRRPLRGVAPTEFCLLARTGEGDAHAMSVMVDPPPRHGGVGYMAEHWTSRFDRDARLGSIGVDAGAGADEVMVRILAPMDDVVAE
jgi:hypothetical protein